jgi:hypothetical protein
LKAKNPAIGLGQKGKNKCGLFADLCFAAAPIANAGADLAELLKFIFAVFGLVSLCTVSSMSIKILNRKPFNCSLCMGFWIGLTISFIFGYKPVLIWAALGAGTSWILSKYVTGDY